MWKAFATAIALLLLVIFSFAQNSKKDTERGLQKGPCDKATTQLELNQCYGEQFSKMEGRLNKVYAKLLRQMQSEKSETAIQKLRMAEKAWIHYRDLHCDAARFEFAGGSISPMVWAQCMDTTTEHRIEELKAAYET